MSKLCPCHNVHIMCLSLRPYFVPVIISSLSCSSPCHGLHHLARARHRPQLLSRLQLQRDNVSSRLPLLDFLSQPPSRRVIYLFQGFWGSSLLPLLSHRIGLPQAPSHRVLLFLLLFLKLNLVFFKKQATAWSGVSFGHIRLASTCIDTVDTFWVLAQLWIPSRHANVSDKTHTLHTYLG